MRYALAPYPVKNNSMQALRYLPEHQVRNLLYAVNLLDTHATILHLGRTLHIVFCFKQGTLSKMQA